MCVYSMIVDHYSNKWLPNQPQPYVQPYPWGQIPPVPQLPPAPLPPKPADIEKQLDEFKKLLEKAREYDKRNNEPDCDLETKKDALRVLAKHWGIDISFLDKQNDGQVKENK